MFAVFAAAMGINVANRRNIMKAIKAAIAIPPHTPRTAPFSLQILMPPNIVHKTIIAANAITTYQNPNIS